MCWVVAVSLPPWGTLFWQTSLPSVAGDTGVPAQLPSSALRRSVS
jgi:hypothetical protein